MTKAALFAVAAFCLAAHPATAQRVDPAGPVAGAEGVLSPTTDRWRDYASPGDRSRIDNLDRTWRQVYAAVSTATPRPYVSGGPALSAYAGVVRPGAAVRLIPPAPGAYRCRSIQLNATGEFYPYGFFRCRIALSPGGSLSLTKLTGSQRQAGQLFPAEPGLAGPQTRLVFLGTLALGSDERGWPRYGFDAERNMAGVVERLGANRYRLVTPGYNGQGLDVLELIRTGN